MKHTTATCTTKTATSGKPNAALPASEQAFAAMLRPELGEVPLRMRDLPVDPERGYPVPWFVEWVDGKPEFRLMDGRKWEQAVRHKLCWVCGRQMGAYLVFVLGPMCGVTRTTSEPACHRECARWSAQNCPFLAKPRMVRRDDQDLRERGAKESMGGIGLRRNPGVVLLWVAHDFKIWRPAGGGMLIRVGDPVEVEWWAEGRRATRAEVAHSIRIGMPLLEEQAREQKGGIEALREQAAELIPLLPEA